LRILLDECVPRRLKRHFRDRGLVLTVTDAGLSGYKNGQLLRRISGDYNVFITIDKSIQHQQNFASFDICLALLRVVSNDIADIEPVLPRLLARWHELRPGTLLIVE
jgi:predicted nuclease of predicted toxin-antitoxin system